MKKALILAAALSTSASSAFAGGPVVIVDEGQPEVVTAGKTGSGMFLPLLLGVIIIGAVAGGGNGT